MTTATDVIALETDHLLQVYRRGRVVFERGRGCRLFDAEPGEAILCFAGLATLCHVFLNGQEIDFRPVDVETPDDALLIH